MKRTSNVIKIAKCRYCANVRRKNCVECENYKTNHNKKCIKSCNVSDKGIMNHFLKKII